MLDLNKINIENFHYFDSVTSTSDVALGLAKQNAPEYSLVFSEEQTKGRGRFERVWQTYPYNSIAMSFIMYDFKEAIPLVLCCSLYKVLKEKYKSKVAIKWPNDIYFNDKKLSGILVESFPINNGAQRAYIVGIGLNIFAVADKLDMVGFLQDYTELKISREELLNDIFAQIKKDITALNQGNFCQFKDYFMQNCLYLNENINVQVFNKTEQGIFAGINDQGYLILKQKEVILNIPAGQIVQQKDDHGEN